MPTSRDACIINVWSKVCFSDFSAPQNHLKGLLLQPSPPETQPSSSMVCPRTCTPNQFPVIMLLVGDCILNSKYMWHKIFKHGVVPYHEFSAL